MSQTPKQMAGAQRRSLATIQRKLELMATEWADVDEFNSSELHGLAQRVEEVSKTLTVE
ncbi:hypothetical protein [Acidovorax carolinensis]|jgi:hypothetical protein|uniref:hypothetical protein n=1 Tax=Acidovorax carolinensis TaxID=553814 RepID=UPI0012FF92BB|nr:hypothetical protein [Acidovorax carolinensis]